MAKLLGKQTQIDPLPRIVKPLEQARQTLVPEAAIEGIDARLVHRLARPREIQSHLMRLGPLIQMQQAAFETHIFRHSSAKVVAGLILTKRQGDPLLVEPRLPHPRILQSQPKDFAEFLQE